MYYLQLVQVPRATPVVHPAPKLSRYPVALLPGQYGDHFKRYSSKELSRLPLNTVTDFSLLEELVKPEVGVVYCVVVVIVVVVYLRILGARLTYLSLLLAYMRFFLSSHLFYNCIMSQFGCCFCNSLTLLAGTEVHI